MTAGKASLASVDVPVDFLKDLLVLGYVEECDKHVSAPLWPRVVAPPASISKLSALSPRLSIRFSRSRISMQTFSALLSSPSRLSDKWRGRCERGPLGRP